MNKRLLLIFVGAIVGLIVIVLGIAIACTPRQTAEKQNEQITLTYWRLFDDKDKIQPLIDEYEKTHSNVKIEYRKLTFEEYEQQLNEAIAAGRGPDMFSIQDTWMPEFYDKIAPIPEKDYATGDYEREFYPAAKATVKDNRIYGIPISMDVLMLYVNGRLLNDAEAAPAPRTWEELTGVEGNPAKPGTLQKINNRQGDTFNRSAIALGNNRIPRSSDVLALLMLQQRTNMVNEEKTQALYNLTQSVEGREEHLGTRALTFFNSFANSGTKNYSWNTQMGDAVTAFAQGRVAMMIGYAYHAPTIERLNPDLSYDISPVPQIAGTEPVNYASFWAETVSKTSQHQQEAWEFIRFITERDQMITYSELTRTIPARKDANPANKLGGDVQKQLDTAVTWYKGDATEADEIFRVMIDQVLKGEAPQRAIDAAANRQTGVYRKLQGQGE